MSWFSSTHRMRGTCPNDRMELFEPDRLTPQQIAAEGAPFMDRNSLALIGRFYLQDAKHRLHVFLRIHNDFLTTDEIVHDWNTSVALREMLEEDVRFFRGELASANGDLEDIRVEFQEMVEAIQTELTRAHAKYVAAAKEAITSLRFRMNWIRENSPNQPTNTLTYYEAKVEELGSLLSSAYLSDQRHLARSLGSLSQQINVLGRKLCSQVQPDRNLRNAEHPGLDEEDLRMLEVAEQLRQQTNGDDEEQAEGGASLN